MRIKISWVATPNIAIVFNNLSTIRYLLLIFFEIPVGKVQSNFSTATICVFGSKLPDDDLVAVVLITGYVIFYFVPIFSKVVVKCIHFTFIFHDYAALINKGSYP